ncbi:MAG: metallophosphoesterase [Saprospiraceae bacterium]
MIRVAFVTDQHISVESKNLLRIDTVGRFLAILEVIKSKKYDALILGGDLCYMDGELQTYQWFMETLQKLGLPYYIISGNHDDSIMMYAVFNQGNLDKNGELYYQHMFGGLPMLFLDSSKGYFEDEQYNWLHNKISKNKNKTCWINMHHPPLLVGSKHMDGKYAFQQIEKFAEFCDHFPEVTFHIFSGHCHMERTIQKNNMMVYITPSSYVNIDPDIEEFTPSVFQKIGFRELIWDDSTFYTNVLYIE